MSDRVVEEFLTNSDYRQLIIVGDLEDLWKASWKDIMFYNRHRFEHLGREARRQGKRIVKVNGNHDHWDDVVLQRAFFSQIGWDLGRTAEIAPLGYYLNGWHYTHGHEFDGWCNVNGETVWPDIAHVATHAVGIVEKIFGWPLEATSRVNPARVYSPASPFNTQEVDLHEKVEALCRKTGQHRCIGHTHQDHLHIGDSWALGNPGGLSIGRPYRFLRFNVQTNYMELAGDFNASSVGAAV